MFSRKVWDALSGDEVLTLAHKHIVKTVSFTQVRASPVSACDRGTCPTALWPSLQDSGCLLTGGNDKLLRIYDLSNTDAGDPAVPSAGLRGGGVFCCLTSVSCSSSGDRRSYVGDQKSSVVQQRQANPLRC